MFADLATTIAAWVTIVGGVVGVLVAAITGWTTWADHQRKLRNERAAAELHAEAAAAQRAKPSLQTFTVAEQMDEIRRIKKAGSRGDWLEHGAPAHASVWPLPWAWLLVGVWGVALVVWIVGR